MRNVEQNHSVRHDSASFPNARLLSLIRGLNKYCETSNHLPVVQSLLSFSVQEILGVLFANYLLPIVFQPQSQHPEQELFLFCCRSP